MFLNKESIMLLLKLMRVFLFNKGHIILIGSKLLGKQSISQFAASLQKKNFIEFDEALLDKSKHYIDTIIKRNLTEIYYKKQESVLFFKDKLLKKVN